MRTTSLIVAAVAAFAAAHVATASDQMPASPQTGPIALRGATIHPVTSAPITNATIVFDHGRITALGRSVDVPGDAEVIDARGKHIYPGMINAYTSIGLTEVSSVRGTRDSRETGRINPNVRAEVSVNPASEIIPVTRANGITLALTVPSGGTISGRSALLRLDGWTWEDMVFAAPVGMHVQWPRMTLYQSRYRPTSEEDQKKERQKALAALSDAFDDARAYRTARADDEFAERHPTDLRWEAMKPVFDGTLPVLVTANNILQIQAALAWAEREDLRLIIVGGADAWMVTQELKERDVPVIVTGTHRLPSRRWEDYDTPFALPAKLYEAGVKFCISSTSSWGGGAQASNTRNMPYDAATAAAYGLPVDEALKAVTLYPARILGVDDRVGSLEVGKDATLIVTDGDPLETPTLVSQMYIEGRKIDLTSRHTMLYDKYRTKYGQ